MANPPSRVKFLLNWNHFHEHLSNSMARLMIDSTYSDVIIATGDKRMIYGHRFVLANSSKYFHRLLRQMNRQRGLQLVVALPEVKYEVLKVLMNYMYRGETQVSHDLLPTVIKTGRLLEINGLVDLHEADSIADGASIWPYNNGENQPSRAGLRPAREVQQESRAVAKPRARVGASRSAGRRQARRQNADNESNEQGGSQRSASIRRFRPILPKNETPARGGKKESSIRLPLKRKYSRKDQAKENPPSTSSASATITTATRKSAAQQEGPVVKIKRGSDENTWQINNRPAHEVTMKTELPFEIDEMNNIHFSELFCDVCKEGYSTHAEWVRHTSHPQPVQGQQAEQEQEMQAVQEVQEMAEYQVQEEEEDDDEDNEAENEGTETVYNCVICSDVMYSASEWIQHIRVWHTDAEPLNVNKGFDRRSLSDRDPRKYKNFRTRKQNGEPQNGSNMVAVSFAEILKRLTKTFQL